MIKKIIRNIGKLFTALIIIGFGVGLALVMQTGAKKLPIRQYFPSGYTNAVWDWSNPLNKTPKNLSDLTDYMYLHQINTSYVDVGTYVTIENEPSSTAKATDKQKLENALSRYVTALGKRHIKVYAAAGDTAWSNPSERHIPLSILAFVHSYNQSHPTAKLAGVQFDIESYNQDGFATASNTSKALVLTDYLDTVDVLSKQAASYQKSDHSFGLGFAIPYWYDNENGNIPSVTWRGQTGPTLYHVLDRLNRLPNTDVVVMAYRNVAAGNDGIIAHARTEVDYAQSKAPNVRVIIGQEVNQVSPAKITYYDDTLTDLSVQVKAFEDQFGPSGVLGGVAVNDLTGYQAMQDQ
jgi:hypothetical protein